MIDRFLYASFEELPPELCFENKCEDLVKGLREGLDYCLKGIKGKQTEELCNKVRELYIKTPALVTVMLNYKISVEFGMPLDSKIHFEFSEDNIGTVRYTSKEVEEARRLFLESIEIARTIYRLEEGGVSRLQNLDIPEAVRDLVYTSFPDKYTWMASNPRLISDLAKAIQGKGVDLVVGSAHGAIRSGLMLANMLECDLYFIRQSLFKRSDTGPIISESDIKFLESYDDKRVLLFDEDVCKGDTIRNFEEGLGIHLGEFMKAAVIAHSSSSHFLDNVGKVWD